MTQFNRISFFFFNERIKYLMSFFFFKVNHPNGFYNRYFMSDKFCGTAQEN